MVLIKYELSRLLEVQEYREDKSKMEEAWSPIIFFMDKK
jgi:hypothetical protein